MRRAIDHGLQALIVAENDGRKLPLSLDRFAQHFGTIPTCAMNRATSALLEQYWKIASPANRTISVQKLCTVADIELVGRCPVRRRARTVKPVPQHDHDALVDLAGVRPKIRIPPGIEGERACISVAHEIGHVLVHRRSSSIDEVTSKLSTSPEEEALAEYAARLLLMPGTPPPVNRKNIATVALAWAEGAGVTVHAATARIGDPDQSELGIRGAILWRFDPTSPRQAHPWERITPAWHLCPNEFIPIGKCHAKMATVVGELAGSGTISSAEGEEEVRIGSLEGRFHVHAVAWGSLERRTRLVLSFFLEKP
jgi:IrrE N-terminal-like domain